MAIAKPKPADAQEINLPEAREVPPPDFKAIGRAIQEKFNEKICDMPSAVNAADVMAHITKQLDQQRQEVVARLLGLDTKWNKPEIDRQTSRDGGYNAPLAKMIQEECEPLMREWVAEVVAEFKKKNEEIFKKNFRSALRRAVSEHMSPSYHTVGRLAEEFSSGIRNQLCNDMLKEMREGLGIQHAPVDFNARR